MSDYGRRIVVDREFEGVVGDVSRAMREEGLQMIARVDVRDHFRARLGRDFRRYVLLEAWSPELAFDALRADLDVGAILPTTFAIYELADGETAVVAKEPLSPMADRDGWRRQTRAIAAVADRETERVARVLTRVHHASSHHAPVEPAA